MTQWLSSPMGRILRAFKREFVWVGVFSFFANLLMLTPTLYMLQLFDRVMLSGNQVTLAAITLITLIFFAVMAFADWIRSRLLVRSSTMFDKALSTSVFHASFQRSLREGPTKASTAFTDLMQLRQFLTGQGIFAFFDTPWMVIYIGVLFLLHPWLGWASVFFAVLMFAVAAVGNRISTRQLERSNESATQSNNYLQGKLRYAESLEALGMFAALKRHWLRLHDQHRDLHESSHERMHSVQAVAKFIQLLQASLMLALAALLAIDGKIGMGALVASNSLAAIALRPIGVLVSSWRQSVEARLSFERLNTLLEAVVPDGTAPSAARYSGNVTVRGLTATAPRRKTPILDNLNAEFRAGEVVAIIGPSGAGKSTFARCVLGIWPDVQGDVLLDDTRVQDWPRAALGDRVGYLPQDIELFAGTIAENIARFGELDSDQVIAAAKRTGIHEMVLRFPSGYDTPMGEAGNVLSGGQRQRIGLARALYGNPALVVLDEPSASLDDDGEAALARAVRELKAGGTTVFMIVHQPHLLTLCDRVLVLEAGRIVKLAKVALKPQADTLIQVQTL